MAEGRRGALQTALAIILMMIDLLLLNGKLAKSEVVHNVGGEQGWNIGANVNSWPRDKDIRAKNILFFNYTEGQHTVLRVSHIGYITCDTAKPLQTFSTGNDYVQLGKPGIYYFICGVEKHCESNDMRMSVTAVMNP